MKCKLMNIIINLLMIAFIAVMIFPLWSIFISSLNNDSEIHFWIKDFSLSQYRKLLSGSSGYFYLFFRSSVVTFVITICQCMVSITFGFLVGRFRFKGRMLLIILYSIVLLLPYSATLLPNYMMIRDVNLLNTQLSIIIPASFSPLGCIIMTIFISIIPQETIDAVLLETNSVIVLLKDIIVPQARPGVVLTIMISFTEAWNMVEQPQAMMDNNLLHPLSSVLGNIFTYSDANIGSTAGVFLYILPTIFLLWSCRDLFNESITVSKIK